MKFFRRTFTLILLFVVSFAQLQAAIVTNSQIIHRVQQTNEKDVLLQTIARADVQEQLLAMGVTSTDIESRVNQMTQEEVAQLNQRINQLPAGGSVLGTITLIFIVFVITDVIGATDIFPFIHPVR